MRIKSVTIRNYRVHRELSIQLDNSRTLIGGPNECGKSTLVEAVHRALFLKAKVTGEALRGMVSTCHAGAPEVEVTFTVGDSDYHVSKRFGGNSGTSRLAQIGGETWFGDEAETRLAALLKIEAVGGGRGMADRVAQQWSHLWVWQGENGNDPIEHANLQKSSLLQRLQEIGGAAALQSELDALVAARFAAAQEELFTQTGKAKTNSELDKAERDAASAEAYRLSAAQKVEKLREAAADFESATNAIAAANQNLNGLKGQTETVAKKLAQVVELRQLEASQAPGAEAAKAAYEDLKGKDGQITELRGKIQNLENSVQPLNAKTKVLEDALTNARQHSNEATQNYEQAANRARNARMRRDLAAAWVTRFEKEAQLQELSKKQKQIQEYQQQLNGLREELAKVPEVTSAKLKKLRNLEAEVNECEAALRGMAAGVEVLECSEPVRLGQASLQVGESQVITELTEIAVGASLRLRITPGGGTKLQDARKQVQESRKQLREQLDELVVGSVIEATDALTRRTDISGKIEIVETALTSLHAEELPDDLAAATEAVTASVAQVELRTAQLPEFVAPAALPAARQSLASEEERVNTTESEESQAKVLSNAAAKSFNASDKSLSEHLQAIAQQNNELTGLRAQLTLLISTNGDDEARAKAIGDALLTKNSADAALTATRTALAELQPDILEKDQERLERALKKAEEAKHDAETKRAVAQAALRCDGTDDPEAELALATARVISAREHLETVRRKADAIRLLHQFFLDEQRSLAEQFTKPFAEHISAYLQCLFGAGARVAVALNNNNFEGLQLVRPSQGGGAVSFGHLSGGAREQVAAAVRLAMAEVLAADHDGCLPVVFDDAFAYSDPERVQTLQRMLDLAASRGLQLLVLTCNPSDYAGLGASQVWLSAKPSSLVAQPIVVSPGPTGDTDEDAEDRHHSHVLVPISDEHTNLLLTRLQEAGGQAGNLSLRARLGWDESTYNSVKDILITSGRLIPGRGRGGSVALPGKEQI